MIKLFLIMLVISAIPLFFLWVFVHEGSHALAGKFLGFEIKSFKPYPHKDKEGNFLFGSVEFTEEMIGITKDLVLLAPYYMDEIVCILSLLTLATLQIIFPLVHLLAIIPILLCLGPLVNSSNGLIGLIRGRDTNLTKVSKKKREKYITPISSILLSVIIILISVLTYLL